MTQNALNNRVVHGQPIQVAPQAAACGVPAVPLRKGDIPFECVRGFPVTLALRLVASFAAIQRGQNDAVNNAAKDSGLPLTFLKIGPDFYFVFGGPEEPVYRSDFFA